MKLGIDFGTCNSSAAYINSEKLTLIKDPTTQSSSIPSSVYVSPRREIFVGKVADNQRKLDPTAYRRELKRDLERSNELTVGEYDFQLEELIGQVLAKMKREADASMAALNHPAFTSAVLTVPATYDEYKRGRMRKAGTIAGFADSEILFLEEPVAAAWYYAHVQQVNMQDGEILLVYDLGGGTFDAALLEKQGDDFIHRTHPDGLPQCGGIDFDQIIYQDLLKRYPAVQKLLDEELDEANALVARISLGDQCIELKHNLSEAPEAAFPIMLPGLSSFLSYKLTQVAFNQMIEPIVRETIECCRGMIQQAKIRYEQIHRILLVGGSCRIPHVQNMLKQEFKRPIYMASDLEWIVCQGAVIHATRAKEPPKPPEAPDRPANSESKRTRGVYRLNSNIWHIRKEKDH